MGHKGDSGAWYAVGLTGPCTSAYHGTSEGRAHEIIRDRAFRSSPKGEIGPGVYFFVDDLAAAWWWAERHKTFPQPAVVLAWVDRGSCLRFNTDWWAALRRLQKRFQEKRREAARKGEAVEMLVLLLEGQGQRIDSIQYGRSFKDYGRTVILNARKPSLVTRARIHFRGGEHGPWQAMN